MLTLYDSTSLCTTERLHRSSPEPWFFMAPATHGEAKTGPKPQFTGISMCFQWSTLTIQMEIINRFPIIGKSSHGLSHSKFVSHPFTNASNIQWRTCKGRGAPQRGLGRKAWGTSRNIIEIVDIYIMWTIWIKYNTMYIIVYMIIYVYIYNDVYMFWQYVYVYLHIQWLRGSSSSQTCTLHINKAQATHHRWSEQPQKALQVSWMWLN